MWLSLHVFLRKAQADFKLPSKDENMAWNSVVASKCRQPLEEFPFGWDSEWTLEAVCGYWTLTWACGAFLQSSPAAARPSHRLFFVFCNHLTEGKDTKQNILYNFEISNPHPIIIDFYYYYPNSALSSEDPHYHKHVVSPFATERWLYSWVCWWLNMFKAALLMMTSAFGKWKWYLIHINLPDKTLITQKLFYSYHLLYVAFIGFFFS